MSKICFKNGLYYSSKEKNFVPGDVLVEGAKIVAIGQVQDEGAEIVDLQGKLLAPTFVNSHTHVAMGLLRGHGSDKNLGDWLNHYIWPAEAKLTDEDVFIGTQLGILEMISSGTTAFAEMYDHAEAIAEAVSLAGVRANICRGSVGMFDETYRGVKENQVLFKKWHNQAEGRIRVTYGPHAPNTCPPDYIKAMVEAAKADHAGIHIHLAETKDEVEFMLKNYQKTPTQYLQDLGVFDLDVPTIIAHGVYLLPEDQVLLVNKKAVLAHNPVSNMKLASGRADVPAYLKMGGSVSLGTDGASSNNTLDMLREMQIAALLHKLATYDPTMLAVHEVFEMATICGAEALGFRQIGEIAVGKEADLQIIDTFKPHHVPWTDHLANLVYSARSGDICAVYCQGKCLYKDGEFLTLDKEKIMHEAKKVADRILK